MKIPIGCDETAVVPSGGRVRLIHNLKLRISLKHRQHCNLPRNNELSCNDACGRVGSPVRDLLVLP